MYGAQGKRKAASQAVVQQRRFFWKAVMVIVLMTEPDAVTGGKSEDDSDFSESGDDDADFTVGKNKVKEIKKKEVEVKSPVEKKEKKLKSKCDTLAVTSRDCAPAAVKSESQPSPKKVSLSSEATRKPVQISRPPAESRKAKWIPPAISGSSSSRSWQGGLLSLQISVSALACSD